MTHHEQEIAGLKDKLLMMASLASRAVKNSIKGLVERDDSLAQSVRDDDSELDTLEVEIDETAIRLLSKGLLAGDLRLITMASARAPAP